MAKKKPAPKPSRESGELVSFSLDLPPRFHEAVREAMKREQRNKRTIVERAFEAYFISTGIWEKSDQR